MLFTEFVSEQSIIPVLKVSNWTDAIKAMLTSLYTNGAFDVSEFEVALKAVVKREELGSTVIGNSLMIPHGKTSAVSKSVACVAICPDGLEANTFDGSVSMVKVLFLLLSPLDSPADHLRCLGSISKQTRSVDFINKLLSCESRSSIWDTLLDSDKERLELNFSHSNWRQVGV